MSVTDQLPLGDLKFYDNRLPGLAAGNYWVTVTHALSENSVAVNQDALGAVQEFVVSAPQFTLPPEDIVSRHPPDGSSGRYAEQLPHVVLREPTLPWERQMPTGAEPWLALLVLSEDEAIGPAASPTHASTASVTEFLKPDPTVFKPAVIPEDDVDQNSTVSFVVLAAATFTAIMPRREELRFLAHCRQANISDKAAQGLDQSGYFAIVFANRFPAAPAHGSAAARKNIVHLVSLEGLDELLVEQPDFGGRSRVALVSLASWTFQCLPDAQQDFRGLLQAIVSSEMDGKVYQPEKLALRLKPASPLSGPAPSQTEASRRLAAGFVPLAWHTRTGEDSFAWYRGPFTPVLPAPLIKTGPFLSADAALAFQKSFGVFDMSLAAAWTAGRAAALADQVFGQSLLDFRRRAHRITDQLHNLLVSKYFFTQSEIATLDAQTTVQDEFLKILDTDLLAAMNRQPAASAATPGRQLTATIDPKAAVQAFLADPAVQQKVIALVQDDLDSVARWLGRLALLYPVPFDLLVPDERMLPTEALRFFYVDTNWTDALLDGAMSIGLDTSRQTFFHLVTHGLIRDAAAEATKIYRQSLIGVAPPTVQPNAAVVSGLLLRSGLVSGWPNLAVRPYLANGDVLKTLRMDHLSPSVLLCLFLGVPDWIEISEPQEGLRFGVDDDGNIVLRNVVAPSGPNDPPIGRQIGQPMRTFDPSGAQQLYTRAASSRVLDLAPDRNTGLVQAVQAALTKASRSPPGTLGPAAFSLQMTRAPEAIKFATQPSAG